MEQVVIGVDGMSCQGCVKNVTGALAALDGVSQAEVSLEKAQARVSYDPAKVSLDALRAAVEEAGFDVR
ncbi:MAG: heavy-metal-associated domain-containing protein [Zoogloea sp.]|nr:heavy-metal-associated domain-containing protein [Zoogloea sp.]